MSDLHLSDALPRTFQAFSDYLAGTTADAVFILGDLFEAWVGDDMAEHGFERECTAMLARAAQHRTLGFMVGNRDFLAGRSLQQRVGWMTLPDPTLLQAWGQCWLLSHGDALCLADLPYQAFRTEVRGARWQAEFLARPLEQRLQIAADIRRASQSRRQFDGAMDADLDGPACLQLLQAAGSQVMIHGHTHRPADHDLGQGCRRHVLSDWDLDRSERAEVMRLTASGLARLSIHDACQAP